MKLFKFKNKSKKETISEEKKDKKNEIDLNFISKIQPMGNLLWKEDCVRKGTGFETCIVVNLYKEEVEDFWLLNFSNIKDVIVTIDVGTLDDSILKDLSKSIEEFKSRARGSKTETEKDENLIEISNLKSLHNSLYKGSVMKEVKIRLFISKRTKEELIKEVKNILNLLDGKGFVSSVYLNELEIEFKSIFNPISSQKKAITKRGGKEILAQTLGAGINYHYTYLNDPKGTYFGTTFTGGNVVLDIFHRDSKRKFYNGIIYGKMGSGKSTFLKKLALTELSKGNKVRVFDASGEFVQLAKGFNSKFISLDGSDGMINPFQVFKSVNDIENPDEKNAELSFQQHLSKLDSIFKYFNPDLSSDVRSELNNLFTKFYIKLGLINEKENGLKDYKGITDLSVKDYPTVSDFNNFVKDIFRAEKDNFKRQRLDRINLMLEEMINSFGSLFNGHSSFNIQDEDFVAFNIKTLSSYKDEVFNAVVFNVLSILWNEMVNNTSVKGVISEDDTKYLVLIDEAHRLLSSGDEKITKFFEFFLREARKYLGGIWFSFHLLEDNQTQGNLSNMSKIFKFAQYKVIFSQDTSSANLFKTAFNREITESEINILPRLKTGECILSIAGYKNIAFRVFLGFEEEKNLIATGGI